MRISSTYVSYQRCFINIINPFLVAMDEALSHASSITGNKDMTLYHIIETIVKSSKSIVFKGEKSLG